MASKWTRRHQLGPRAAGRRGAGLDDFDGKAIEDYVNGGRLKLVELGVRERHGPLGLGTVVLAAHGSEHVEAG